MRGGKKGGFPLLGAVGFLGGSGARKQRTPGVWRPAWVRGEKGEETAGGKRGSKKKRIDFCKKARGGLLKWGGVVGKAGGGGGSGSEAGAGVGPRPPGNRGEKVGKAAAAGGFGGHATKSGLVEMTPGGPHPAGRRGGADLGAREKKGEGGKGGKGGVGQRGEKRFSVFFFFSRYNVFCF